MRARLDRELRPSECLLWAASVSPPRGLSGYVVAGVLCAICWGIGIVGLSPTLGGRWSAESGPGTAVLIVGVLCCVVGFFLLLGLVGTATYYLVAVPRGPRPPEIYAMTDKRAIFWAPRYEDGKVLHVSSIPWDRIEHVRRVERPGGKFDLLFSLRFERYTGPESFRWIDDGPSCEELARTLIEAANSKGRTDEAGAASDYHRPGAGT